MKMKRAALFVLVIFVLFVSALGAMSCSNLSEKHTVIFNVQYDTEWTAYASLRTRGATIIDFPSDPTKEGYVFAGWYIDKVFSKEGHEYDYETTELTEDVNYYAKFVPASSITNPYTITFQTNKGSAVEPQEINFGGKLDAEKITTVRPGFGFEGWYTDSEFLTPWNVKYDRVWKSRTLYAKWYSTGYILTYELNGGTNHPKNPAIYKFEDGLSLQDPTRLGYDFLGWYLDAEFTEEFDKEKLYDDNLTIYAKWSDPKVYTIEHAELEAGDTLSGEMPTSYTVLDNPLELPTITRTGYDFTGWIVDADKGILFDASKTYAEDLYLTPSLTMHVYNITYMLDGGTNNSDNLPYVTYFENTVNLHDPAKKGYAFSGWYSDDELQDPFTSGTQITEDITLYAKWAIQTYTITYHKGDATCVESPSSYTINDNPLTLPTPTKTDLYFGGWYLDSELTRVFDANEVYAENLDLYPKFVSSEMLQPENYYLCSSAQALIVPKNSIQPTYGTGVHVCIPTNEGKAVKSVWFNGSTISASSFIYSAEDDLLVIANSVFAQKDTYNNYYIVIGDKYDLVVTFSDNSTKYYCLTINNGFNVILDTIATYDKSSSSRLELRPLYITLTAEKVYDVSIDGYMVDYSIDGDYIVVDGAIINKLATGRHCVDLTMDQGTYSADFNVANSTAYAPYNVKVDIDSDPGKVWISWDNDFDDATIKVRIGANEYTKTSNPTLFVGNKFNATGLLTTSGQQYSVVASILGDNYPSSNYTFKYNITDSITNKYLTKDISVYGKSMNRFITSWEELYDILFYTAIRFEELDPYGTGYEDYGVLYLCFDFDLSEAYQIDYTSRSYKNSELRPRAGENVEDRILTNGDFITSLIFETLSNMPEALPSSVVRLAQNDGPIANQTYKLGFKYLGAVTSTTSRTISDTGNSVWKDNEYYPELYGANHYDYATFPIETNNLGNATVTSSVELYLALEHGYNPVIPSKYTELISLYNEMKVILRSIVDESMNDYQKVAAIYQWLAAEVLYDHTAADESIALQNAAAKSTATAEDIAAYYATFGWSCFYMEGVFINRLAVCNGIASAYSAMCNMLGIKCYKLIGTATDADDNVQQHAWNKVFIGGKWYVSDATWGSTAVLHNSSKWEILTYNYLFMTERQATVVYKHIAKATPYGETYANDDSIDKFKVLKFTVSSTTYNFVIENAEDFDRIFDYTVKTNTINGGDVIVIEAKSTSSTSVYNYASAAKYLAKYEVLTLKDRTDIAIMVRRNLI